MAPFLVYKWRPPTPPHTPILRAIDLAAAPSHAIAAGGLASGNSSQSWISDELPADAVLTAPTDAAAALALKPVYQVPLMSEIRQVPWNGLTVVSTFAGGGGSSTGYRMAGYKVLAAVEFVPAAGDSYAANKADYTRLIRRDVRQLTSAELMAIAGIKPGELDVFDGSPPCEPFSSAGQREASWVDERAYSGQRQRTDDLFFEYARLVSEIQPKVFVAENVTGLVKGRAKGYFKIIMAKLRACGYRVQARTLDAAYLGVPQHRQRVIFMGVREDLNRDPVFPTPLPYVYTVRDALPHILRHGTDPGFDTRREQMLTTDQMMADSGAHPHPTVGTRTRAGANPGTSGARDLVDVDPVLERRIGGSVDAPTRGGQTSIDEPAPTVIARNGGPNDRTNGLYIVEPGTGFFHDRGSDSQTDASKQRNRLDEPAPTITSGGQGHGGGPSANQYWITEPEQTPGVYQDSRGSHHMPAGDLTDRPLPTVTGSKNATDFQVVEPEPGFYRDTGGANQTQSDQGPRRRKLTIPELKRISGFPDDYQLVGTFGQQWERLGDCVPPPMAAAWAAAIRDHVLGDV